jgi:hypothetical protein
MLSNLWRLEQLGRVVVDISVDLKEAVEGAHAAQYATLRAGMDADVVQAGGKVLKVGKFNLGHVFMLALKIGEKLVKVVKISIESVR